MCRLVHGLACAIQSGYRCLQEHGQLVQAVTAACGVAGLQPVPALVTKCLQLQDTMAVRFGVMLVGPAGEALVLAFMDASCKSWTMFWTMFWNMPCTLGDVLTCQLESHPFDSQLMSHHVGVLIILQRYSVVDDCCF